jgi:ABC-2 type transport system permease protein
MVIPFDELPGPLADVSPYLPSGALADVMRETLVGASTQASTSWAVLGSWALAAPVVAALSFRWE